MLIVTQVVMSGMYKDFFLIGHCFSHHVVNRGGILKSSCPALFPVFILYSKLHAVGRPPGRHMTAGHQMCPFLVLPQTWFFY